MSTQCAGDMINEEYDEPIIDYKTQTKILSKRLKDKNKRYRKIVFDYVTEKFIASYKHIKSNEYTDFDNFVIQYNKLFDDCIMAWERPLEYLNLETITKYITENFNHDVVLNFVYSNIYKYIIKYSDDDEDDTNLIMSYEFYCEHEPWKLIESMTLLLIQFYMKSNNENDIKIIQNRFPGFEYTGTENIHKVFWNTNFDTLCEYLQVVSLKKFIDKYNIISDYSSDYDD